MTTTTNTTPHETSTQASRTPIFCEKTGKLLARIDTMSAAELADVQGGLWCWCKGCHAEHHIPWATIAHKA